MRRHAEPDRASCAGTPSLCCDPAFLSLSE